MGDLKVGGPGQKLFEQIVGINHRRGFYRFRKPSRGLLRRGNGQVNLTGRQPWHLARHDANGARDQRLLGIAHPLLRDLRCTGGEDAQMQRRVSFGLGQGLRKPCKAPEALFDIAIKSAGAGAWGDLIISQPEMRNPVGHQPLGLECGEQLIIARAPLFGGQSKVITGDAGEGISRRDLHHAVPLCPQLRGGIGPQPCHIGKDEPVQRAGQAHVRFGISRLPMRQRPPFADVIQPLQRLLSGAGCGLARLDEVTRALELIARQQDAVAPCLAPDLRPVGLDPAGPEPPDHA